MIKAELTAAALLESFPQDCAAMVMSAMTYMTPNAPRMIISCKWQPNNEKKKKKTTVPVRYLLKVASKRTNKKNRGRLNDWEITKPNHSTD
jgi:hypothetical protein